MNTKVFAAVNAYNTLERQRSLLMQRHSEYEVKQKQLLKTIHRLAPHTGWVVKIQDGQVTLTKPTLDQC